MHKYRVTRVSLGDLWGPMLKKFILASRHIVLIPIFGALLASVAILLYGFATLYPVVRDLIAGGDLSVVHAKRVAVDFIEMIDLFLIGTVLYIVALGLYELFIDASIALPRWLIVKSLDDLKEKLIGVTIVLLAVTFLADTVEWDGSESLMHEGIAVAAVIVALALSMLVSHYHAKLGIVDPLPDEEGS